MNKMGIKFEGFEQLMARLQQLDADVKGVTEDALRKTHAIITEKAEEAVQPQNLPAGGHYSRDSGGTLDSLVREAHITWNASVASVDVGFDIKNGGLPSIFMMYGKPSRMKNQKLWDAFYGQQTLAEVEEAQAEIFYNELWRREG